MYFLLALLEWIFLCLQKMTLFYECIKWVYTLNARSIIVKGLYYFDSVSLKGHTNKGINRPSIEFNGHLVDWNFIVIQLLIEGNWPIVVVYMDCESVSLQESPTLSRKKGTMRSLEPTLLWLNWVSWWFQLAIMVPEEYGLFWSIA